MPQPAQIYIYYKAEVYGTLRPTLQPPVMTTTIRQHLKDLVVKTIKDFLPSGPITEEGVKLVVSGDRVAKSIQPARPTSTTKAQHTDSTLTTQGERRGATQQTQQSRPAQQSVGQRQKPVNQSNSQGGTTHKFTITLSVVLPSKQHDYLMVYLALKAAECAFHKYLQRVAYVTISDSIPRQQRSARDVKSYCKPGTPRVGLKNEANNCYANAVLIVLLKLAAFSHIRDLSTDLNNVSKQLDKLDQSYKVAPGSDYKKVSSGVLLNQLNINLSDTENDALEFYNLLANKIPRLKNIRLPSGEKQALYYDNGTVVDDEKDVVVCGKYPAKIEKGDNMMFELKLVGGTRTNYTLSAVIIHKTNKDAEGNHSEHFFTVLKEKCDETEVWVKYDDAAKDPGGAVIGQKTKAGLDNLGEIYMSFFVSTS